MTATEQLKVTCHCGWNVVGARETVIEGTRAHVQTGHWTEVDDEDILDMAEPA